MTDDTESGRQRLLVADDSKLMRVSAKKVLSDEFELAFANDGEQAWQQLLEDTAIQAVFTDLTMPNLDGFELLERIRTAETGRINSIPVIVITSGEDEATRERAYQLGATDFVAKPFDSVDLRARARSHVTSRVQQSQLAEGAAIDSQTGLYNRRYFLERLGKDRSAASRHGLDLAILHVELADFRNLFLKNGKDVANDILARTSELIRHEVRSEDTVARTGLASFTLALPFTAPDGAQRLGERLTHRIASTRFPLRSDAVDVAPQFALMQVPSTRDASPETLLEEVQQQSHQRAKTSA